MKYVPFRPDFQFDTFSVENAEYTARLTVEMHLKRLIILRIVGVVNSCGFFLERLVLKIDNIATSYYSK